MHHSGSGWLARPSPWGTSTSYSLPASWRTPFWAIVVAAPNEFVIRKCGTHRENVNKAADIDNAILFNIIAPLSVRSSTAGADHSGIFTLWRIMVLANFRILMGFPSRPP